MLNKVNLTNFYGIGNFLWSFQCKTGLYIFPSLSGFAISAQYPPASDVLIFIHQFTMGVIAREVIIACMVFRMLARFFWDETANNGDKHCECSHFYINFTFRMLVKIHFQKWTVTVFITSVCFFFYDGPRTKVFRFFWFIQLAATHHIIWRFNFFASRSLWERRHCVEWHYLRIFSFSTVARLSLKGHFWNVLEVFENLK